MNTEKIVDLLDDSGIWWNIDSEPTAPNEEDLKLVLDKAAGMLYAEPVGAVITVAGLVVEKTYQGFDLYVYAGNYE